MQIKFLAVSTSIRPEVMRAGGGRVLARGRPREHRAFAWNPGPIPRFLSMTPPSPLHEPRLWLGLERNTTSHGEKWISAIGALLCIVAVYWITRAALPSGTVGLPGGMIMLTSMGASAVLLFAVPQGALSQPWAVVGGHLVSATLGVARQKIFPDQIWTAALTVGLAVGWEVQRGAVPAVGTFQGPASGD